MGFQTRTLCLEGTTGAGKTTQAKRIKDFLQSQSKSIVVVNEKEYEPFKQAIIDWYNAGAKENFTRKDVIRLAEVKGETHKRHFVPLIGTIDVLLFDRSIYTGAVYQASEELSVDKVTGIYASKGVIVPEEGVILVCNPETSWVRINERRKIKKNYDLPSVHENLDDIRHRYSLYLELARKHPELHLIDTEKTNEDQTFSMILNALRI